jgi:glycosyltransferase involved in cell wall biosynthesis
MTIAVNANFLNTDYPCNNGDFIFECFSRLAKKYPQHNFIYFVDANFDEKYITSKNITTVITGPQIKNPFLLQYRLNYKIPSLLKKYKADIFISAGGYCSLRTKLPQCVIINDLSFLQLPQFFSKRWLNFYKKNTEKFLTKAKVIVTTAEFFKKDIINKYKIASDKIDVANTAANNNFKPSTWQQKDAIKEKYAEGLEYFLYAGPVNTGSNLITLLKAFSFFKKRQKSNMQLLLMSKSAAIDKDFIKSLASYKYRDEVKSLDNLSDENIIQITGAAYAMIYPSLYDGCGTSLLQAMQSDIPVITANNTAMPEICSDAALYINPSDFNDIAEKMMLLFKDEDLRNELIIKGRQQAAMYNWDKTADKVWEIILKCSN